MMLLDPAIRLAYKQKFEKKKILVDEIKVGRARVDLLDLSEELHGYEIKSDGDNYSRLRNQTRNYNKYLSRVTIIIGSTKKETIEAVIPEYWGIIVAEMSEKSAKITFKTIRESKPNPYLDKKWPASLLWKQEMVEEICRIYKSKSYSRYQKMKKWKLVGILQKELTKAEIIELVRTKMIIRLNTGEWR